MTGHEGHRLPAARWPSSWTLLVGVRLGQPSWVTGPQLDRSVERGGDYALITRREGTVKNSATVEKVK